MKQINMKVFFLIIILLQILHYAMAKVKVVWKTL